MILSLFFSDFPSQYVYTSCLPPHTAGSSQPRETQTNYTQPREKKRKSSFILFHFLIFIKATFFAMPIVFAILRSFYFITFLQLQLAANSAGMNDIDIGRSVLVINNKIALFDVRLACWQYLLQVHTPAAIKTRLDFPQGPFPNWPPPSPAPLTPIITGRVKLILPVTFVGLPRSCVWSVLPSFCRTANFPFRSSLLCYLFQLFLSFHSDFIIAFLAEKKRQQLIIKKPILDLNSVGCS